MIEVGDLVNFYYIENGKHFVSGFVTIQAVGLIVEIIERDFGSSRGVKILYDNQYFFSNENDCKKIND